MKSIKYLPLCLLALACGAESEAPLEGEWLGTAEQAVYMPARYGHEGGNGGPACGTPGDWADNECWVPNSKRHYVKIHANTCTPWWQARFTSAWNETLAELAYINSYVDADKPKWEMAPADSGMTNGVIFQWMCDPSTIASGSFSPNESNSDDIGVAGNDELKQYKGGVLKIYASAIQAGPAWAAADDARRQRFARNVIRHEIAHQLGLGHESSPTGLMGDGDFWNNEYWMSGDQYRRIECYNPANSGLFDDCK